ncbi:hypothetical protein L596_011750 [Steinernema carpocapsae]|uniref:YitH/HolE acetyltransferase (GNAT) domain-containing protein n=1 Tax=Steinernema carpocapsae TaxID=34508 RepID=A0A4U5NUX1_STECR|nr:hypothetical protein L596_011750 [Steinernema carpocapsae]
MTQFYEDRGFKFRSKAPHINFDFSPRDVDFTRLEKLLENQKTELAKNGLKITEVDEVSDGVLNEFDRSVLPIDRSAYTPVWLRRADVFTRVCVDSKEKVVGYACLKVVSGGRLITSPVFARNKDIAFGLLLSVIHTVPNVRDFAQIMCRANGENLAMEDMVNQISNEKYEKAPVLQTMFTEMPLKPNMTQIFGVSSTGCVCI